MSKRGWIAASMVVLAATAIAVGREPEGAGGGSRLGSIGMAGLMTVYMPATAGEEATAIAHVLFVPAVDRPHDATFSLANGAGGTAERYELSYALQIMGGVRIDARPVVIHERRTFEADGHSFDLADGNIFLVHVNLDGTLLPVQVRQTFADRETSVKAVLSAVKAAVPNDRRVQALDPDRT